MFFMAFTDSVDFEPFMVGTIDVIFRVARAWREITGVISRHQNEARILAPVYAATARGRLLRRLLRIRCRLSSSLSRLAEKEERGLQNCFVPCLADSRQEHSRGSVSPEIICQGK